MQQRLIEGVAIHSGDPLASAISKTEEVDEVTPDKSKANISAWAASKSIHMEQVNKESPEYQKNLLMFGPGAVGSDGKNRKVSPYSILKTTRVEDLEAEVAKQNGGIKPTRAVMLRQLHLKQR